MPGTAYPGQNYPGQYYPLGGASNVFLLSGASGSVVISGGNGTLTFNRKALGASGSIVISGGNGSLTYTLIAAKTNTQPVAFVEQYGSTRKVIRSVVIRSDERRAWVFKSYDMRGRPAVISIIGGQGTLQRGVTDEADMQDLTDLLELVMMDD